MNSGSGTVTVINAETNTVAATIRVQRQPYFIDVDAQGERAYVANSEFQQCLGAGPCASP